MRAGAAGIPACALLFLSQPAAAAPVKLTATAQRQQIFIKEHVILTVRVHGITRGVKPDMSAIEDCDVQLLESSPKNSFRKEFINGKWTQRSFSGWEFVYSLTPQREGKFRAGPIRLKLPGRTLAIPGPAIEVTGVEEQDLIRISVVPSRDTLLIGDPFTVSLHVDIKALAGRFADLDPILPREPLALQVPYLDGGAIPGLAFEDLADFLQRIILRSPQVGGFTLNNFTVSRNTGFFGGTRQVKARFRIPRTTFTFDGKRYMRYTLTIKYIPKREGHYTFGPIRLKGRPIERVTAGGEATQRGVIAIGPACTVRVVPPPAEGRPDSYTGAVETNMQVEASVDANTCRVGDPLLFTLAVSGEKSLENMQPPALHLLPELTRQFKVYTDAIKTKSTDTQRIYTYTVRPAIAGTLEIPAVEIAYFDPVNKQYRTVRTAPIPIRANEAVDMGQVEILDHTTNRPTSRVSVAVEDMRVPAPLSFAPAGLVHREIGFARWHLAAVTAAPLAWLLFLLGGRCRTHLKRRAQCRPRETALRDAARILQSASKHAPGEEAAHRMCEAMQLYISRRFDVPATGITPADAARLLSASAVESDLVGRFNELFERNFNAAYSYRLATRLDMSTEAREAEAVLREIESALRKTSGGGKTIMLLLAGLFVLATDVIAGYDRSAELTFVWEQANALAASAHTREDFLAAARLYRQLTRSGLKNGVLFHNLGTVLLKAGEYDEAMEALLRAERYTGTTWELERNMLIAHARDEDIERGSLPWYRLVLFWHYGLPCRARLSVAVLSFTVIWLCLILRKCGLRAVAAPILTLSIVLLVLFGSSAATSIHQEARADIRASSLTRVSGE